MYNKILFLDDEIIYPIISYKIYSKGDIYNYFQYELFVEISKNNFNSNSHILSDKDLVLFSEDNLECDFFSKTYFNTILQNEISYCLSFEVAHINKFNLSDIDCLKHIARDLKIKSILDI